MKTFFVKHVHIYTSIILVSCESRVVLKPDKPMPTVDELAEKMFKPMTEEEIQRAVKLLKKNAKEVVEEDKQPAK